ncbi:DUF748 domain-containing protein [Paraglaciecola sp.]|uniref:DUF748 domain-containing protein n=1 Tax=Paraglaciecola sp. TaxID=1920173 RepID=UPI00326734B1
MTSSTKHSFSSLLRGIFKYLLIFMVLVYLLIWITSPWVVRYFATEPVGDLGLTLGVDSSIRFNPFTSTLTVRDLSLLDTNRTTVLAVDELDISVRIHRLLFKQIYISTFSIKETKLKVTKKSNSLYVAGINLTPGDNTQDVDEPTPKEVVEPIPDFRIILPEFKLENFTVNADIDSVQQTLTLNDFSLNDVEVDQVDHNLGLSIDAKINNAPVVIKSSLSMHAGVGVIDSEVSLNNLDLDELSPLLADFGVNMSGLLSFSSSPKLQISADEIKLASERTILTFDTLLINYEPWIFEGKRNQVTLNNLLVKSTPIGELTMLSTNMKTEFTQGNLGLQSTDNSLINWELIDVAANASVVDMQPHISESAVTIKSLNLSEDRSLAEDLPIVSIQELSINDIKFNDNFLSIDAITLQGLLTDLKINPDKSILSLVDTSALNPDEASAKTTDAPSTESNEELVDEGLSQQEAEQKPAIGFALNKFMLVDDAIILLNDQSVSPTYDQKITIETLQIGPINSLDTDLQSPYELKAKDQSYLKIDASGFVSPFGEALNASLFGNVDELSLPSISPYMKDALGFEMKSGQLDLNLDVKIIDDQIAGDTTIFMRGIEMASADEVEQGTIKEGKAMPLNIALGMLKDDQDNIELTVPLRGNIASPSFGIESFIGLVLKKAAMSQAKDYLMTTFVPYASVVSVALSGAEYLLKVRFEPLLFETGEVSLTDENQQYLSELVLLMQDKPELQLKTCSISNYQDLAVAQGTVITTELKSEVKVLGDKRQANLKTYLIEQGIKSSRILYCSPELDTSDTAQSRIELKTD